METSTLNSPVSKSSRWTGRILSGIAVLFMLFDGTIHLIVIGPVVDSFNQLGIPVNLAAGLGILELIIVIIYLIPRTSVLGAVLLTGYLGGAVSIQFRINAPLFSTAIFPVYIGILAWGGIYLRNEKLRSLFPVLKLDK
jgi:hypothetical protein